MRLLIAALFLCLITTHADARPRSQSIITCDEHGCSDRQASLPPQRHVETRGRAYRTGRAVDGGLALGSSLVASARHYLGTNPTGWSRVWCGRFMAMIAPDSARRIRNPNMARSWAELPHTGPQVGAIAVLSRRGGGHVGVVTGFEANGDPIIISGNHGRRVGEGVYSKHRIVAYVLPS